jgi:hypothetical protein
MIEIVVAYSELFRRPRRDETIRPATKPFFTWRAELRKRLMVINPPTTTGGSAGHESGDSTMRTVSFILALAFVVSGSSMAGSAEGGLPGIGTFAYTGSPVVVSAPVVVALR